MAMKDNKHILYIPLSLLLDSASELRENVIGSLLEITKRRDYTLILLSELDEKSQARLEREGIVFSEYVLPEEKDIAYNLSMEVEIENAKPLMLSSWKEIASYLTGDELLASRCASVKRKTLETDIAIDVDLDGTGRGSASTKLPFFDHMLSQLIKHSRFNLNIKADGDVEIDEHHTVEDIVITLSLDFSQRVDFIYDVEFKRELIGTFPSELFRHFFRTFADSAKCNLYISATGGGDAHHTAEGMFKAFARALRKAVRRIPGESSLPSTKGVL